MFSRFRAAMFVLVVSLLGVASGHSHVASPTGKQIKDDPRFRSKISAKLEELSVEKLLAQISETAEVVLLLRTTEITVEEARSRAERAALSVQPALGVKSLILKCSDVAASELLNSLAVVLHAEWRPVQHTWVLVDTPGLEKHAVLPWMEKTTDEVLAAKTLRTLSPLQLAHLRSGQPLRPEQLSPVQRDAFRVMMQAAFMRYPHIAPEALRLQGPFLAMQPAPEGLVDEEFLLHLMVPTREGETEILMMIPSSKISADPRVAGLRSARLAREANQLDGKYRIPTLGASTDVSELKNTVRLPSKTVSINNAVGALLHADDNLDLVLNARFQYDPLSLKSNELTSGALMSAIAEKVGGKWLRVGEVYALKADPNLESAKELSHPNRINRMSALIRELSGTLRGTQVKALKEKGSLPITQLTRYQRELAQHLVLLAYAENPGLPLESLDYDKLKLKYFSAAENPIEHAMIMAKDRDGKEHSVAFVAVK